MSDRRTCLEYIEERYAKDCGSTRQSTVLKDMIETCPTETFRMYREICGGYWIDETLFGVSDKGERYGGVRGERETKIGSDGAAPGISWGLVISISPSRSQTPGTPKAVTPNAVTQA
eukprot:gene24323-10361_t